jgi:hypothetical protein
MQVGIGVKAEAFKKGAPGLLFRRWPNFQLGPPKPSLEGVRLVSPERVVNTFRFFQPDLLPFEKRQYFPGDFEKEAFNL